MATLVLTAVGSVLGGPIGAAIGAAVGNVIDHTVLFPPKGREGPRLSALQVQTSSYGTPIQRVYGTMRIGGCVIWSTELIESSTKSSGGKGQPSMLGYSYSVSFAVALSGRPITGIRRIWADGKLLRGSDGVFKSETGFRLHPGGEDQAVDPLLASAEGAAAMPSHRGIAYVVFEHFQLADYGNRIPSLTFEVIADSGPVAVAAIIRDLSDGTITGTGSGDALTVDGFAAYGDSVRSAIIRSRRLAERGSRLFPDPAGMVSCCASGSFPTWRSITAIPSRRACPAARTGAASRRWKASPGK